MVFMTTTIKKKKARGKNGKRIGGERNLLPFLGTRLSNLPSISLERNPEYILLDDGDKLKSKYAELEGKGNRSNKKSKARKRSERIARANKPQSALFSKESTVPQPSKPPIRITHERPTESSDKEYIVQWDNVTFEDRYLIIKGVVPRKTIDLFFKPAQASFNFIKRRIKQRLEPFKIQVSNNQVRLVDSIYIGEVIEYMECKDLLEQMIADGLPNYRSYYDRLPSHLSALFFPKGKREYLDILCDLQSSDYKIVPVSEAIGDSIEDSFLFTVEKGKAMYIIWENTNLSRATYIFCIEIEQYDQRLQFVFDYIVSTLRAKRQKLHSEDIDKEVFGNFEIINHTEVEAWQNRAIQIMQ